MQSCEGRNIMHIHEPVVTYPEPASGHDGTAAPVSIEHAAEKKIARNYVKSAMLFAANSRYIPGGCVSLNRKVEPQIAFVRGHGAYLWDADGSRYIDYHAGFAPYLLGHNDPDVEAAVRQSLDDGWTLAGSGTTPWEGRAA